VKPPKYTKSRSLRCVSSCKIIVRLLAEKP
jgi:hypothetical protein